MSGMVAVEDIKAGDKVIVRNPYTFEMEEKIISSMLSIRISKIRLEIITQGVNKKMNLIETGKMITKEDVEFHFIEMNPATGEKYEQGSDLHYFYNIDELMEAYDNLTCEELIPEKYIPIACDSFGNEILLCSDSDKDTNSVYFVNWNFKL